MHNGETKDDIKLACILLLLHLTCWYYLGTNGVVTMTATPVRWAVNGHYYEAEAPTTWDDARAESLARGGYLVTITSADENTFVYNLLPGVGVWLGASDIGYGAKNFHWVDGPEAGQSINSYSPWDTGQPDNWNGNEPVLMMHANGLWNDNDPNQQLHYVTEFAGT